MYEVYAVWYERGLWGSYCYGAMAVDVAARLAEGGYRRICIVAVNEGTAPERLMVDSSLTPVKEWPYPHNTRRMARRIPKGTEIERDSDGWWAYLPIGWCDSNNPQCHTIHEDTRAAVVDACRDAAPCDCEGCSKDRENRSAANPAAVPVKE